jgi:hypothetical protein
VAAKEFVPTANVHGPICSVRHCANANVLNRHLFIVLKDQMGHDLIELLLLVSNYI